MPYGVIEFNLIFKVQKTSPKKSEVFLHPTHWSIFTRSIHNGRACCAGKNHRFAFLVGGTMQKSEHALFLAKVYRYSKNF